MMSPRRKLSCEGSWAEKSNWAWAKLARGDCKQMKLLVGPFRGPNSRSDEVSSSARGWEGQSSQGRLEVELACAPKARVNGHHPTGLLLPAPCTSAMQTLRLCRKHTVPVAQLGPEPQFQ